MNAPHISTYWHDTYIAAARQAYPDLCAGHDLAVGWKVTGADGTTKNGYYWPLVNGDHDIPVAHIADNWDDDNTESCPQANGDGLCLVTTSAAEASSGGISLTVGTGHVLVFPVDLARSDTPGKYRVPWCVDVDCFSPVDLIRLGLSGADLAGADLAGADLAGANLDGANLIVANLAGANLAGADLAGADLAGADLTGADLAGADLAGADLDGANLARAYLARANLTGANLDGANLAGADLAGAKWDEWTRWPDGFTPPAVAS